MIDLKKLLDPKKLHPRNWNLRLIWDVFMVWVALVNLWLIVFDITYLILRPTYYRWVPILTRVYDPVKGIEPHPLTEELQTEAAARFRFHFGIEVSEGTHDAADLSVGDVGDGSIQPFQTAPQGRPEDQKFQSEGDGFGVNAMAATDHDGVLVGQRLSFDGIQELQQGRS